MATTNKLTKNCTYCGNPSPAAKKLSSAARPPLPRVALEWRGPAGRQRRHGGKTAADLLHQQVVEWRSDITKYQDLCGFAT